jgi:hypothetical protein
MVAEAFTRIRTREAEVVATVVVSMAEVEAAEIVVAVEEVEVATEECMIVVDFNSNTIRVITISNKTLEEIKAAWDKTTTTFLNSNSSNNTDSQIRTEATTRGIIMIPTTNRIEGEHQLSRRNFKEATRVQPSHPTDRSQ